MTNTALVLSGFFISLIVYLFATAPPELPDVEQNMEQQRPIDVANLFNAMNAINDTARRIYTAKIVGGGKKAGLDFGEDWAEPGVDKGPLPALFLRLVASRMETKPPQLGLYLGSDQPINKSNLFSGKQAQAFAQVKDLQAAVFLKSEDTHFVAMYPDVASAQPCVSCHNEHPDSPKDNWQLHDVMGATTWTYPHAQLGAGEYLEVTEAFYASVQEAYQSYLDKVSEFDQPVPVGLNWPERGTRELPDADTFMQVVRLESAASVLDDLVLQADAMFETTDIEASN